MSTSFLHDVADVHNSVASPRESVTGVRDVRAFDEFADAPPGSILVLDAAMSRRIGDYRFDIALRSAPTIAAVLCQAGTWTEPSLTSRRIADEAGIAIGELKSDHSAVSVAIEVHDLLSTRSDRSVRALRIVCAAIDDWDDATSIDDLVSECSKRIDTPLALVERAGSTSASPIRVQGVVRYFLEHDGAESHPVLKASVAYLARHLEQLLQAEYELHQLPDVTRSELLNDILLSDPAMSGESIGRLRHADFPIDGSHYALRVDCHEPLPQPVSAQVLNRCRLRIAEVMLDTLRGLPGMWNRAGTSNSILLVSSLRQAHADPTAEGAGDAVADAVDRLEAAFPGLRMHVGVGTPHLGASGLRTTVSEATTATRMAKARNESNAARHFDRLGLGRALVRWAEVDGVRPVVDEIMAPILDQTPRQTREALSTLRAYLDSGQSISKTAEALHLHRNTVRYRMDRIARLLPVDIEDPDERLLLDLSCRIVDAELAQ